MALNPALLGTQLLQAVDSAVAANPQATPAQRAAIWNNIAAAIVSHIAANAVVIVAPAIPVQVVPVSGVGATTAPGTGVVT